MTQKEKAKAYDEAIKRAEIFNIDDAYASQGTIVKSIFPQLKESDDERIIRAIYEAIKDVRINTLEDYNSSGKEALAWLESQFKEKQKEQKPFNVCEQCPYYKDCPDYNEQKSTECIDFDNEFENQVSHLIASALNREYEYNKDFVKYAAHSLLRYAEKEQKPSIFPPAWGEVRWNTISPVQQQSVEWSEEDERILKGIIGKIDHDQTYGVSKVEMLSFLKSLRSHWKPTKEQMDALEEMIVLLRNLRRNTDDRKNLETLREQLGKL